MPVAMPLPGKIAHGSDKNTNFRVIRASFGDGYSQRAPDGINAKIDRWSVRWIPLDESDKDTVLAALDTAAGVDYLTWTPPGEAVQKKFVMSDSGYSVQSVAGRLFVVGCELVQVFDV